VPVSLRSTIAWYSSSFEKEYNILDVWFDSGVSHQAVLRANKELGYPADMYLEGKDQHRGWFQSSLLTSVALEGTPSMKSIVTHGYTVDADGRKMSKSLGNVVSPAQMKEELGTDGLRLWAASIGLTDDAVISHTLTRNVQEVFRKVRNTSRFLLSNLYDFDITQDAVSLNTLLPIDRYALDSLYTLHHEIVKLYDHNNVNCYNNNSLNLLIDKDDIVQDIIFFDQTNKLTTLSIALNFFNNTISSNNFLSVSLSI